MFLGIEPIKDRYHHPWTTASAGGRRVPVPLDERVSALVARRRHIAYYYDTPDTSTFRYRVLNMIEALAADVRSDISASWFHRGDLDCYHQFVDRADALVLCRARYSPSLARLVGRARARNIPVLFDVDDLVFDPDQIHLILNTLGLETERDEVWQDWFGWIGRTSATLKICDAAIVTNSYLAERIEEFAPYIGTNVIPNFLNRRQQEASSSLLMAKRTAAFARDERLHLGYFSGTPTHNRDFAVAEGALARLLDSDERVMIRVVGFLKPQGELQRYGDRLEFYPLQNFLKLQQLIAECEINVVPLQDNRFTNCKSELKYFEAAICGTLTVASPTFSFRQAIRDGANGFLARSHEWDTKLQAAIAMVENHDAYVALAERAVREVERSYSWNGQARLIEQAIFGRERGETPSPDPRHEAIPPARPRELDQTLNAQ